MAVPMLGSYISGTALIFLKNLKLKLKNTVQQVQTNRTAE